MKSAAFDKLRWGETLSRSDIFALEGSGARQSLAPPENEFMGTLCELHSEPSSSQSKGRSASRLPAPNRSEVTR